MKLYRPTIPTEVKVRVVLRQLGEMFIDNVVRENRFIPRDHRRRSLGKLLDRKLPELAQLLGCELKDLRLDHNPALGLRKKRRTGKTIMVGGEPVDVLIYTPPANDPDHLLYRSHHAHHIKTHKRGDGAQRSDTAQMKYLRRVEKNKKKRKMLAQGKRPKGYQPIPQRKSPWPKRKFPTRAFPTSRTSV